MANFQLTDKQKNHIIENRLLKSSVKIGLDIGVSRSVVQRFLKSKDLSIPKELSEKFRIQAMREKNRTTFTKDQDDYILRNYLTMPVKTIARNISKSGCGVTNRVKKLGLEIPKEIRKRRNLESRFKKGFVPVNKGKKQVDYMSKESIKKTKATRFKKGNTPHNHKPVGSERITKDGYIEIKIKDPSVWELKHRYLFEKRNKRKIPKDFNVVFANGIQNDFDTKDNLILVSKSEMMLKNTIHHYPEELKKLIKTKNKLKKLIDEN